MSFSRLIKGNIIFRVLNIAANILITILLTRLMSVEGYGVISLLIVNASIFSLASCLGVESGINFHFASRSIQPGKIFLIVYSIIFFQLVLLTVVETVHHEITGHYWLISEGKWKFLLWGLIYLFSLTVTDKYTAFLNAAYRYTLCNGIILAANLITLIIFGWLYFFIPLKSYLFYLQVFISITFVQAILLFIAFHVLSKQKLRLSVPGRKDLNTFFSYSFFAFIINIIQFLAYRVDYWLVKFYQGKDALGWYSLAVKLGQFFWVLPILFASIILPLSANADKMQEEPKILPLIRITNVLLFAMSLAIYPLAGWVIPLFFGKSFIQSIEPFLYMLPGFFLFGVNIMLSAWFAGKNKLIVNFTASAICFFLVLPLDLWFIPIWGIRGAAIANSIAYILSSVYLIAKYYLETKRSIAVLFIPKRQDRIYVANFISQFFKTGK